MRLLSKLKPASVCEETEKKRVEEHMKDKEQRQTNC